MAKRKRYYVSYTYTHGGTMGFGGGTVLTSRPIASDEDRGIIAESFRRGGDHDRVVIMSWIEYPDGGNDDDFRVLPS
jgi:hypothetical protein